MGGCNHSSLSQQATWPCAPGGKCVEGLLPMLGVLVVLLPVGEVVNQAVAKTPRIFGRISSKEEELCLMCQEAICLRKYGIFA